MTNVVALFEDDLQDYNEMPLITIQMLLESCEPAADGMIYGIEPIDAMSMFVSAACYITQFYATGFKPVNYYEIVDPALSLASGVPVVNGKQQLPMP